MNQKQKDIFTLAFLIILLFAINYSFLDNAIKNFLSDSEFVYVSRIIDGDTIKVNNQSIRLLGINSPERGEEYYDEAKEYLENEILNKTVRLEFGKEKYDRYNRILAYIFLNNRNINQELIGTGLANYYFPSGKEFHYNDFEGTWISCINKNINLCEKSENVCAECIQLKSTDIGKQEIVFYNKCEFSCKITGWIVKDEGRKKFIFPEFTLDSKNEVIIKVGEGENEKEILFWGGESYVWTKTGDTLFLRDSENKLVLWESY